MTFALDAPEPSDGEVLRRVRAGETAAYGQLYERHVAAARRVARTLVGAPADADDIVAEVFAATFAAIRRGSGPHEDFLPYVLRSVRHECRRSWRRGGRHRSLAPEVAERTADPSDDFTRRDERELLREAFVTLPARMQTVLWSVEVDGLSHAEIARRTRSTAPAIGQLAVRARRSLGLRYLQAHLAGTVDRDLPVACARARASLAELVRGTANARRRRSVTEHLAECPACAAAHDDLCVVNDRLRGLTLLAVATTVAVPKRWAASMAMRTGWWLLGSTAPLTAAATIVVATVAPSAAPAAAPSLETAAVAAAVDAVPADLAPAGSTAVTNGQQSTGGARPQAPAPTAEAIDVPVTTLEQPSVAASAGAPVASPSAAVTTPPETLPPATAAPARPGSAAPDSAAPPPAAVPEVTASVAIDVPALPLPALPPLPLIGQVSETVDIAPVAVDVTVDDTVEADVSVGGATVGAEVGGEGVSIEVGGSVDVPIVDVPPIEVPPIEVPPVELPPLGLPILGG